MSTGCAAFVLALASNCQCKYEYRLRRQRRRPIHLTVYVMTDLLVFFILPSVYFSPSLSLCVCLCVSVCSFEREWTRETVRRRDESENLRLEKRMRKRQRTVATRFLGLHRWILLFHPRLYRPNTSPASLCYKLDTHITFSKPLFAWIADRRTDGPTDRRTNWPTGNDMPILSKQQTRRE